MSRLVLCESVTRAVLSVTSGMTLTAPTGKPDVQDQDARMVPPVMSRTRSH